MTTAIGVAVTDQREDAAMRGRGGADDDAPIRPNTLRNDATPSASPPTNVFERTLEDGPSGVFSRPARRALSGQAVLDEGRLPGVSGRWSALGLLGLFALSALAVPLALHRALWVQAEVVIGIWFVIWSVVLTALGYSGRAVEQDWGPFRSTWERIGRALRGGGPDPPAAAASATSSWLDGVPSVDLAGGGEGCAWVLVAVIVIAILYVAIGWLIPLVAFTLYEVVRQMLNRVGESARETRGDMRGALGRGILWAAVYTAPLALAVWAINAVT